jgi:hypothetical protein
MKNVLAYLAMVLFVILVGGWLAFLVVRLLRWMGVV